MNPRQRQMIKEAYKAGYQEALDENIFSGAAKIATRFGRFLKKIFRGGGDDVTSTFRNLQDRVSDLEGEIIDQMGNDGREIINNMNTFGKNLSDEQRIDYYRDVLRREAEDLPDINNPLDDLP